MKWTAGVASGSRRFVDTEMAPPFRRGRWGARSVPVAVGAGPDELHAFLAFDLDQGGVDRSREARVVQLDRKVVALGLLGLFLPRRTQLGIMRCTA